MKELKNYLHLYLGCRIFRKGTNGIINSMGDETIDDADVTGKLVGVDIGSTEYPCIIKETATGEIFEFPFSEVRPILRPISDMTEEEKFECLRVEASSPSFERDALQTAYLLSKHFDLFGLTEAGLAIDKTKQ